MTIARAPDPAQDPAGVVGGGDPDPTLRAHQPAMPAPLGVGQLRELLALLGHPAPGPAEGELELAHMLLTVMEQHVLAAESAARQELSPEAGQHAE